MFARTRLTPLFTPEASMTVGDADHGRVTTWSIARLVAILSVALLVSVAFALPQILHMRDGYDGVLLQSGDEAAYMVRVQEVRDGHWRVGEPYMWEHKGDPPMLPYTAEVILSGIATAIGITADQTLVAVRFVAPAILALVFMRLLWVLTGSYPFMLAGSSLALLEPGTYFYKPYYYLTRGPIAHADPAPLMFTRILNPLVLAIPFVVALVALYGALTSLRRRDIALAGILVGINFYSQLFYWAYLYAGMFLLGVFLRRDRPRLRAIAVIACIGVVCGSFALAERVAAGVSHPHVELLSRVGILIQTHKTFFLFPKGLIVVTLAFAALTRPRDVRYFFILSFLVGGYLLLNQNIVTGLEIQNYHFHYANSLVAAAAVVTLAWTWLRRRGRIVGVGRVASAAAAVVVIWLGVNAVVLQARTYRERMMAPAESVASYPSNLKHGYEQTLRWVDAYTPTDSVFLADPRISFLLPLYTHANVFLDPIQKDNSTRFTSDDELFERWMIYFNLQGLSTAELMDVVRYQPGSPVLLWEFGRNDFLKQKYNLVDLGVFSSAMLSNRLPSDYVSEFEKFPVKDIDVRLRKYRLDYLVTTERDYRFAEHSSRILSKRPLTLVADIQEEGVKVYAFGGHGL